MPEDSEPKDECPTTSEEDAITLYQISRKLSRDLKLAATTLSDSEARYLVDAYYQQQELRKRAKNQVRQMELEPTILLKWLGSLSTSVENTLKHVLGSYAQNTKIGAWSMGLYGIGPVISAGLLAHIDITRCPTVGHIWTYAGLNPNSKWLGKNKATIIVNELIPEKMKEVPIELVDKLARRIGRNPTLFIDQLRKADSKGRILRKHALSLSAKLPWNKKLKRLCWIIGECFKKFSNDKRCFYGHIYRRRKVQEEERNAEGRFADQAAYSLKNFKFNHKETRGCYEKGLLPKGRLDLRAMRYATKIFLAHWHHIEYYNHYGENPTKPYILTTDQHTHYIAPPGWKEGD